VLKSTLLPANEGTGYISYTHTYLDQTGIDDPDCARFIGSTGQPYITGAWPGDYWLFQVPVTKFEAGTKVRFSGLTRTSPTGQNYWLRGVLEPATMIGNRLLQHRLRR